MLMRSIYSVLQFSITRQHRRCMTDKTFEKLLLFKENKKLCCRKEAARCCHDTLVPSYLGSWLIVSLRFLCHEFSYHLTPLRINQSPTGCLRRVWFLLVGGPLARFEVRVLRHHVAPARITSHSAFGCCWRQFVSFVDRLVCHPLFATTTCWSKCSVSSLVGRS